MAKYHTFPRVSNEIIEPKNRSNPAEGQKTVTTIQKNLKKQDYTGFHLKQSQKGLKALERGVRHVRTKTPTSLRKSTDRRKEGKKNRTFISLKRSKCNKWALPGTTLKSLKIVTLNIDGLREAGRSLALAAFAVETEADILVITESHLRVAEARRLQVEGYTVVAESSR